jgi:hypothetical protein
LALSKILKTIQENTTDVNPELLKFTGKFEVPEKVYGREEDLTTLMDEMNAVKRKRKLKSINIIGGISGMGKTYMVMQVRILLPPTTPISPHRTLHPLCSIPHSLMPLNLIAPPRASHPTPPPHSTPHSPLPLPLPVPVLLRSRSPFPPLSILPHTTIIIPSTYNFQVQKYSSITFDMLFLHSKCDREASSTPYQVLVLAFSGWVNSLTDLDEERYLAALGKGETRGWRKKGYKKGGRIGGREGWKDGRKEGWKGWKDGRKGGRKGTKIVQLSAN